MGNETASRELAGANSDMASCVEREGAKGSFRCPSADFRVLCAQRVSSGTYAMKRSFALSARPWSPVLWVRANPGPRRRERPHRSRVLRQAKCCACPVPAIALSFPLAPHTRERRASAPCRPPGEGPGGAPRVARGNLCAGNERCLTERLRQRMQYFPVITIRAEILRVS